MENFGNEKIDIFSDRLVEGLDAEVIILMLRNPANAAHLSVNQRGNRRAAC